MRAVSAKIAALHLLLVLLSTTTFERSARADIYRSDGYSFNIFWLSPADVESAAIAESIGPNSEGLAADVRPVLARWQHAPCYVVYGNPDEAQQVQRLVYVIETRTGIHVSKCDLGEALRITFFFSGGPSLIRDEDEIRRLFGSSPSAATNTAVSDFLESTSICNLEAGPEPAAGTRPPLQSAQVLINRDRLGESGVGRCLFAGLIVALGLQPQGLRGHLLDLSNDNWAQAVELNLLGAFTVYSLDDASARGTRLEVDDAIRVAVRRMHVTGN